ncbi:MAG: hypothetical protein ACRC6V_18590 [Bacteroidales bacterium]
MKPIFVLNAPARVGKDTIANHFVDGATVLKAAFKDPLYAIFMSATDLSHREFHALYETPGWKDTPQAITNGKTPREFMIHISEKFIKPFYGDDYFGKWVGEYISRMESDVIGEDVVWVIPDSGFQGEYDALRAIHGDRLVLISLWRDGHDTFTGDSRGWVFDWYDNPLNGAHEFDTTHGNEKVIEFIQGMINKS